MPRLAYLGILLGLASYLPAVLHAAIAPDPLFASREPLNIELVAPFALINRERDKDKEYDGSLVYTERDGTSRTLDVQFSVRGNFRLRRETCNYAPLWLNLRRSQLEGTLFANQNRIKLAVQCRNANRYQDFLVREEQVYRLLNSLTEISFLTRLAEVRFSDSERTGDSRTSLAFFIEHHDRLAERVGMSDTDVYRIERSALDEHMATLDAMFMYMISNVDYSLVVGDDEDDEDCCHNTKLLQDPAGGYFPVPYDFDVTGYVDASYAEPLRELGQRTMRQRIYRGFCTDPVTMQAVLQRFNQQRSQLNDHIEDQAFQDERSARRSRNFVDAFYGIINDPDQFEKEVLSQCR